MAIVAMPGEMCFIAVWFLVQRREFPGENQSESVGREVACDQPSRGGGRPVREITRRKAFRVDGGPCRTRTCGQLIMSQPL